MKTETLASPTTIRSRLFLPVVLAATFIAGFDVNVVNVALPSLQHDLRAGPAALQLVVGGYGFSYAAGLVTGGRLGDLFGHRRLFVAGMGAFVLASALCGAAANPAELVAARLVQGLAAAAMTPQVLALITAEFAAGEQRGRALSWFGVVMGLSGIAGQVLGGLLLVADVFGLAWRVIFLVNVPIGAVAIAGALRVLPRGRAVRRPRFDPVGVVAVSGALALLLVPLVFGRADGWPAWTWISLGGAVPAFAAAWWWERRLTAQQREPLVDLTLFGARSFRLGLGVNAAFMMFFTGFMLAMSVLLQTGLGLSAVDAGLCFAPMAIVSMTMSMVSRAFAARYGLWALIGGCGIAAVALAGLGVLLAAGHGMPWLLAPLTVLGAGTGVILPSLVGAPLADVRAAQAGIASGTLSTAQQFAGATGIAVLGSVFFTAVGPSADYLGAAAIVVWLVLALIGVMITLTWRLAARPGPTAAPARRT